ncbi:response regulator [Massilia agilis]|uniref:Response regulator n=1 Tax=Massilia agilis TaxID=1811226 RepID=A0ABT2D7G4_9BURK|nr:response regulator [Massilia agilis]MCS0807240.1 response regulator [Massilia agilis]
MRATTVLAIVDDDEAFARALRRVLGAYGYATVHFPSGTDLVAAGDGACFACLVIDIELGPLSGFDLYRFLRDRGRAPPAVFVTGQGCPAYLREALALGCLAYLEKPFESADLLRVLDHLA